MNRNARLLATLALFGVTASCAVTPVNSSKSLTLDQVEKISIGSSREDLEKTIGAPDLKVNLQGMGREAWLYFDGYSRSIGRLSVHVDSSSGQVKRVIWNLHAGDPEQNIDVARARYPEAQLNRNRKLYDYGDYMKVVETFEDPVRGLKLGYDDSTKHISSISRSDPNDKIEASVSHNGLPKIVPIPAQEKAAN